MAADKGYHAAPTLELCQAAGLADVHRRAAAAEALARGPTNRRNFNRPCMPIVGACGASQGQAVATPAERTMRTDVCPHLRPRWHASQLGARGGQACQTLPDRRRGAQSGPDLCSSCSEWASRRRCKASAALPRLCSLSSCSSRVSATDCGLFRPSNTLCVGTPPEPHRENPLVQRTARVCTPCLSADQGCRASGAGGR